MQERLLGSAPGSPALGRAALYFGCRRRDQDYLYGQLLEEWAQQGKLTLFTAFSREQVLPGCFCSCAPPCHFCASAEIS
jgi:sulfite reductase alpha subunit-like flavoprotein